MPGFRSNLAAAAVIGLVGSARAARTCAQAGAQLSPGYAGYGDEEFPGLLPQGRTYCDPMAQGNVDNYCDVCPESCQNIEATIRVVNAQLDAINDQTSTWNVLESDVDMGCALLQATCLGGVSEGGAWTTPVYSPYPSTVNHADTVTGVVASESDGVVNWGPEVVGSMTEPSYCSYCASINFGYQGRRLLGAPVDENTRSVSILLDSKLLLSLGSTAAFGDCALSASEIASSPSATHLAKSYGRVEGAKINSFFVPGCALDGDGTISQTIDGERRVTVSKRLWEGLGYATDGVLSVAALDMSREVERLVHDFETAGCRQLLLKGAQCAGLKVVAFESVSETRIDNTIHALLQLKGGKTLISAEVALPIQR